jgi:photosystem II stability/assembly factor-like uncharacterized protein
VHARWLIALSLACSCAAQDYVAQNSGTAENLRGVSAVSAKVAWASGTHGTYLRTLDGGNSWNAAQVPGAETFDFRDVEAFSADAAFLLSAGPGDQSRIYKTTDGGKRWTLQFTNHDANGFFDCMAFWDRAHGIALGDPIAGKFELIATNDGGKHWKQISPIRIPAALAGEGAFAASGTCIAVQGKANAWFGTGGKVARVFRSTDRGKTWTVAETPIVHGTESSGIFSIAFRDAQHGVIAGGDYKHPEQGGPNLAWSDDGGLTWNLSEISPQAYFSAAAFDPQHGLLAVGAAHAGYTDDIRKKTWVRYSDLHLNAVSFASTGEAVAVGAKGAVVRLSHPLAPSNSPQTRMPPAN